MIFKFDDLFPNSQFGAHAGNHDKANWALCGAGDVVRVPNTFSYRAIYFNRIMKAAKFQAAYLGVTLSIHQEGDFINFEFRKVEHVGQPVLIEMPPAYHSGTHGSEQERLNSDFYFVCGYQTRIDFYPIGEPQPSEKE